MHRHTYIVNIAMGTSTICIKVKTINKGMAEYMAISQLENYIENYTIIKIDKI